MCTSPRIIKNPRKQFIPYVDREYIKVPCGHCLECRNKKRNELYFLAYFEYLFAKYSGGFTQFFTLTYDDAHLPTFGFRPCFNYEDVQKYLYRVRSSSKRVFGKDFKFRFLLTCEYGHLNKRPHYHLLLFVQSPCNHYKFRNILKSCWFGGFSFGSWDNFGEVNRPNGIRYVTKYVCKDTFDDADEKKWLDSLKDDREIPLRLYYMARRHTAQCKHSKKFGYCALDHILKDSSVIPEHYLTSFDHILKNGEILAPVGDNGIPEFVSLPRTLYRRLFYFVTWRYKRVTSRDVKMHYSHGTPVPKHKVQSFYIPNIHYKEKFKYEVSNRLNKANVDISLYLGDSFPSLAWYSLFRPPFSTCTYSRSLDYYELLEKLCDIKMSRDPIFSRDPFDKEKFYYERAPLEKTDFPDIQCTLSSMYNSNSSALLRFLDAAIDSSDVVASSKNFIIEKTYRDNKALCV